MNKSLTVLLLFLLIYHRAKVNKKNETATKCSKKIAIMPFFFCFVKNNLGKKALISYIK